MVDGSTSVNKSINRLTLFLFNQAVRVCFFSLFCCHTQYILNTMKSSHWRTPGDIDHVLHLLLFSNFGNANANEGGGGGAVKKQCAMYYVDLYRRLWPYGSGLLAVLFVFWVFLTVEGGFCRP